MDFQDILSGNYSNCLNLIYGPAATGKSTFCLIAALEKSRNNKKVIFFDMKNGFCLERFKQLAGENYKKYLENILVFKIKSFKEQQSKIKSLDKIIFKGKISLIILDTICFNYQRLQRRKPDLAKAMLSSQLRILKEISKKVPVLITSDVYYNVSQKKLRISGGTVLKKYCDCIIKLEKENIRKLIIRKPEKKEFIFNILNNGIIKI